MSAYQTLKQELRTRPRTWLVTGAAGFIGSNLVEALLRLGQQVVGLDNFATGYAHNLDDVRAQVGEKTAGGFTFIEGDIRDLAVCRHACEGADYVLHQAALGSVPRSLEDPITTNEVNIDGFLNVLVAARDAEVERFVYASSSSVYGDHPGLPKKEVQVGTPISPYAVTKRVNEHYAQTFQHNYGLEAVGLRYFNVFGRRQDPSGAYAAVIPKWINRMLAGKPCEIYGDGETSRDFCYIDNAVQANLLAACADAGATGQVYNVACGEYTTLNELHSLLREGLQQKDATLDIESPRYKDFRPGDVRHSQADISKTRDQLGYLPSHSVEEGLQEAMAWYVGHVQERPASVPS